jgi:hypothetical protein
MECMSIKVRANAGLRCNTFEHGCEGSREACIEETRKAVYVMASFTT